MPDRRGRPPTPPSLLAALRPDLVAHPPFADMAQEAVDFFIARAQQRYYAPGEALLDPGPGPVEQIFFIRQGAVTAQDEAGPGGALQYEAGELFPLEAAVAHRAAGASYRAVADTFVLVLPRACMEELQARSPPFAEFLNRRIAGFLARARQALQATCSEQVLAEQSLETPLGELACRPVVHCAPQTPLREVLAQMQAQRIGSMLVTDAAGAAQGILTRHDVLGRVALAGVPLDAPVARVMVQPVRTLAVSDTAEDAALLMSRHGVRHVPVTRDGAVVGLVSERDLFALQRLSLKHVSGALRGARDVAALKAAAQDIRRLARNLLAQGVQARQLTALVSHLNDLLTRRLLELLAPGHGIPLQRVCWLALGSEGRSEQTVATDQDNALILPDGADATLRRAALAFGRAVNLALDDCGYPLCRGGIMAGEPGCNLTLGEWRARFAHWIDHGAPADLLQASIYFDLRPLAGDLQLAAQLAREVLEQARGTPRFLKQLALNGLSRTAPLNWLGAIQADDAGCIDLKLQGAALFVDAARLYALAQGVPATGTGERLEAAGARMGLAATEYEGWVGAFEFLQMLRLRVQLEGAAPPEHPNRLHLAQLNDIDRRMLKETFRLARLLQQRMHLDYER